MKNLLTARIDDLITKCARTASACFSDFLDAGELLDIAEQVESANIMLFGGHEECERKILGIFPEWEDPNEDGFPILCIKIEHRFGSPLTHREYLGSILGLGTGRCKIGDIFIFENTACVFVSNSIAEFIATNLGRVGRTAVKTKIIPISEAVVQQREFKVISTVCASERGDAVIAAMLNISRTISKELIVNERVELNHRPYTDGSKPISEGTLISVRGYGRYILESYGNKTRSDRIHINLKKYL